MPKKAASLGSFLCCGLVWTLGIPTIGLAQVAAQSPAVPVASLSVANRLTQPINPTALVSIKATVHPLANAANDRGAAPDGMPLTRLQILLKRSDTQEAALKQLINDLHTPYTAHYHRWLTPQQFGEQFGPTDADIATLRTWLQSRGFNVTRVNPGKHTLEMNASVAQFRSTFHAQIHKYEVHGQIHYANATDPQIPAALAPVFGGFASLNNFSLKSNGRVLGKATYDPKTARATPQWTVANGTSNSFALAPADFSVQYDLNPLYAAGISGEGQSIAIINEANINLTLVNSFRTLFGLPANPPTVIIDGNDPGIDGINNPDGPNNASAEAYQDVEWAGAVAPAAAIDLVIAADTALQSGLTLAAEHAVYGNIAPVMSLSFSECEAALGSGNQFWSGLWEQAAAQGITVMVSTGDTGSAGCDGNTQQFAVMGRAVNGYASTAYNVAVGGTDFYYSSWNQGQTAINAQLANYWNTTPSNGAPVASIKGVIPEQPWNDSQYGLNLGGFPGGKTSINGGGGGASTVNQKPAWQTGLGVPVDGMRDLPDVALFAADDANSSYYPICAADGDCQPASSGGAVQFTGVGGTSLSAPSFAGMMALVNQKYGPQGQANFVLYPLAAQFPAAFHDVINGTNSVPCNTVTLMVGPPGGDFDDFTYYPPLDCIAVATPVTATDPIYGTTAEGQIGAGTTPQYTAAPGYDQATGLGTIDANVMVTNWGNIKFATSTTTLTPSSTSFTHGTPITVSGSVSGTPTPTGTVALMTDSPDPLQTGRGSFALANGKFSQTVSSLPGGTYNIWGRYSGDGSNAASTSAKTQIMVAPESSKLVFNLRGLGGTNFTTTSIPYGAPILLSAQPAPSSGSPAGSVPTGTVTFADNGVTINTATLNAEGDAEYNAPFSTGSHSVTASYSGDRSYSASVAAAIAFTIAKSTPMIAIGPGVASKGYYTFQPGGLIAVEVMSVFGGPVAAPTGTVTLSGLPAGLPATATLQPAFNTHNNTIEGVATIPLPVAAPAGNYIVSLDYSGDGNYNPIGNSFINEGNASEDAGITIVGIANGLSPSTTAVTSSATSTSVTAAVIITATVTGVSGKVSPTGTVSFATGGYQLGSVTLTGGSGDVATATISVNSASLLRGTPPITVQYGGDGTYQPSSSTISISNGSAPVGAPVFNLSDDTSMTIGSPGMSATSNVTITPAAGFMGNVALTCTVTRSAFEPTGVDAPTCSVTPSAAISGTAPVTAMVTANTQATTSTGSYMVTVAGTSGSIIVPPINVPLTVEVPTTILLSATPTAPIAAGAGTTSTITITPSGGFSVLPPAGGLIPGCSVTSLPGQVVNDLPQCSMAQPPLTSGTAAVTTTVIITTQPGTSPGTYTATGTVNAFTANPDLPQPFSLFDLVTVSIPVTVVPFGSVPSFTLTGTSVDIASPGATGTSTITITPSGGFTGPVALTCAVTLGGQAPVNGPTCSVTAPASISGTAPVTATLTVNTTAPSTAVLHNLLPRMFTFGGGGTLAALLFVALPARRRRWKTLRRFMLLAAIAAMVNGCGGGGGGGTTSTAAPSTNPNGTGAADYIVTVTGTSGSILAMTPVAVTVN
jgi:subtilase family serine protease